MFNLSGKSMLLITFIGLSSVCFAQQAMTKTELSHEQLLKSMYQYFDEIKTQPLTKVELNRFYNPGVKMIMNDQLVAQGIPAFYQHFKFMKKKSHDYSFVFPEYAMISQGNRVSDKYKIIMRGARPVTLHVIADFTFHDGKISKWDEVVSKSEPGKLLSGK